MSPIISIAHEVADAFGIGARELLGEARQAYVAHPRFAAMWIARRRLGYSTPRIARVFNRDHTSVIHGIKRCNELRASNPEYRAITDELDGNPTPHCPHCGGLVA